MRGQRLQLLCWVGARSWDALTPVARAIRKIALCRASRGVWLMQYLSVIRSSGTVLRDQNGPSGIGPENLESDHVNITRQNWKSNKSCKISRNTHLDKEEAGAIGNVNWAQGLIDIGNTHLVRVKWTSVLTFDISQQSQPLLCQERYKHKNITSPKMVREHHTLTYIITWAAHQSNLVSKTKEDDGPCHPNKELLYNECPIVKNGPSHQNK